MGEFKYVGSELRLFADMRNWKEYSSRQLRPFLTGDILEVGAGIGSNTPYLDCAGSGRWVCLEPDADLHGQLVKNLGARQSGHPYETVCGTLESMAGQQFDTVVYIEVLEHISNDQVELNRAASYLRTGGRLVVLSPACQFVFSPFDVAIGHHRRYNRAMLRAIAPPGLRLEAMKYLDCAGLILSAGNAFLLRQSMPTRPQLLFWDRWMVPLSRVLDRLLLNSVGKTIMAVWRKQPHI
jgi:SAM-dependent methyltransferase